MGPIETKSLLLLTPRRQRSLRPPTNNNSLQVARDQTWRHWRLREIFSRKKFKRNRPSSKAPKSSPITKQSKTKQMKKRERRVLQLSKQLMLKVRSLRLKPRQLKLRFRRMRLLPKTMETMLISSMTLMQRLAQKMTLQPRRPLLFNNTKKKLW